APCRGERRRRRRRVRRAMPPPITPYHSQLVAAAAPRNERTDLPLVGCRGLAREGRVVYIQEMPRLRQVSRDQADPFVRQIYQILFGERDPVREPGTETGSPGNWWTVFALSPDCFRHAVLGFQLYRSADRKLDPKLRELGQLRAGWARGSRFVFSQHC